MVALRLLQAKLSLNSQGLNFKQTNNVVESRVSNNMGWSQFRYEEGFLTNKSWENGDMLQVMLPGFVYI